MKYFFISLTTCVLLLGITMNAYATFVEGDITGRYEQSSCRIKNYEGSGTLKISSVAQQYGFPGWVFVSNGNIGRLEHAQTYPHASGATMIAFDASGEGYAEVSGKLNVRVLGMWPQVSSRGNFHVMNGPLGPCWDKWNELRADEQ